MFTPSGYRDIGIRKLGFVAITQFLIGYFTAVETRTFYKTQEQAKG